MSFTCNEGRLGNTLIRNLAVSKIAEKFDLNVTYWRHPEFQRLGIDLFSGAHHYPTKITLTDDNYFTHYQSEKLESNIESPFYYQTKEITGLLYAHLHSKEVQQKIRYANPFKDLYNSNNDVFVHVRLGDVPLFSPGIFYYLHTLASISFDHMYVSTDSPNHPIVQRLLQFPRSSLFYQDEVTTLQFASTSKYVVLSHGTFSAMIGYLAYDSMVYYPEYTMNMWHGDIFSIPGWNCYPRYENYQATRLDAAKIGTEPFGNCFFQNIALSLIAQKFDLKVSYETDLSKMGINLFQGSRECPEKIVLDHDKYLSIYDSDRIEETPVATLEVSDYQGKEVARLVCSYVLSMKQSIVENNPFKSRYQQNNDVFVYIRIGEDAYYRQCIRYYLDAISRIHFDQLYISTDNPNHPIVHQVMGSFPTSKLYLQEEVTTLQFASTFKHVVLSGGTFSAVLGYLSFDSTIYYPEYPTQMWHGDIFSIPGWVQLMDR